MTPLSDKMKRWSMIIRVVSYICGFAGMVMMLAARGMPEPERSLWAQRSFISLGLMFGCFVTYYVLAILRMSRR